MRGHLASRREEMRTVAPLRPTGLRAASVLLQHSHASVCRRITRELLGTVSCHVRVI
jgi:hypothetical protein